MATDLLLEMAELPATGSLGTGQLDTRDLLVAGVPISISSKYLYLYLELSGSTPCVNWPHVPERCCCKQMHCKDVLTMHLQSTPVGQLYCNFFLFSI